MRLRQILPGLMAFALAGCTVDPIPTDDTENPTIRISALEDGAAMLVVTDDAFEPGPIDIDCPQPSFDMSGHFAVIDEYPATIVVSATDRGGVRNVSAFLVNAVVFDVDPVSVTQSTETIAGRQTTVLEMAFPPSEARTTRAFSFKVQPADRPSGLLLPNQFQIHGLAVDYNGNAIGTSTSAIVGTVESFCE